ncbi:hypothetical protein [Haladaptatus caseinilyticus]|uniref:hypothetical protein n=1 Tax=Haladaptatus caseinilyticus TaxID=2993314 RepID=UPI00224B39D3|nr:hypothetical protein [Haladaptatus caseinilyticus]
MDSNVKAWGSRALVVLTALATLPIASAHGGGHGPAYPQWLALVVLFVGVGMVAGSVLLGRTVWVHQRTVALWGVFVGLFVAAAGAVGLVQLSPVETLHASQAPLGREWYQPLTLAAGTIVAVGSLLVGRLKWPERPRYAGVGMLLGAWVAYPAVMDAFGARTHPLGYLLVFGAPLGVGYVLWRDARRPLSWVTSDRPARWFGIGSGILAGLFFAFSMGMLTFVPEHGIGVPDGAFVTTIPVANPLVYWTAVEFSFPSIPIAGVFSPGMLIQICMVAVLVGLNASVIAFQWQSSTKSGTREVTSGTAAVAAPNACCCCGPIISELAVVSVGPSAAAPLYWLFVDLASPVGALFFVFSIALLAGNLAWFGMQNE